MDFELIEYSVHDAEFSFFSTCEYRGLKQMRKLFFQMNVLS